MNLALEQQQELSLRIKQRQDLYHELSLRIKLVETRNVVFLMALGWELCRTITQRAVQRLWYVTNGFIKLAVSARAAKALAHWWVEICEQRSDGMVYYKLKDGIVCQHS